MATNQPPSTAWGALLVAAGTLEQSAGLAGVETYTADYKTGRSDPYKALQDALWPAGDVPRADGGIPADKTTGRPYWAALGRLDVALGGTGQGKLQAVDELIVTPDATVATVAAAMRDAARSTTPRTVLIL